MDKSDPDLDLEKIRALARRADELIALGLALIAHLARKPKDRPSC